MTTGEGTTAIVIGAGSGIGRATALALAAAGTRVVAVGRSGARLERLATGSGPGQVIVRPLDATDPGATAALMAEVDPDLVVVSAGARAQLGLIHEQTWEAFSAPWNTDVRIAFQVGQSALRRPLRPGSTVILVSSGAGLGGSPLSGGYAGAKRMQMFLAGYLQRSADLAKLGIRFKAVVPKQLVAGSELGETVAEAYAALLGVTRDKYMERFGVPLAAERVATTILSMWRGELDGPARDATVVAVTGSAVEAL